jgi:hypothetical protein
MGQVTVAYVVQDPVTATVQVPTSVPDVLPSRISIFPPEPADETRAEKEVAPEPKLTPRTLM